MKSINVKRVKRVRDLYCKIAELLSKVVAEDGSEVIDNPEFGIMIADAKADRAYLDNYLSSVIESDK